MLVVIQKVGTRLFRVFEELADRFFGPKLNPFYQLGGLAFFFYWIVAASGVYLYIFFETSVTEAYNSVERLTHEQWYLGGVMRSLHRYASDAMVLVVVVHLLREFCRGRFNGVRWFSWVSGVFLLWLMYASGVGGYWLVWDELAQFVAVLTSEWLDWLPIFNMAMARNFLNEAHLSDRFFSLLSFLHIGIPLVFLLVMWIHIQRISQPKSNPVGGLAWRVLLAMVVLSLIKPAISMDPANLDKVVTVVDLDWFYLGVYPLMDSWSYGSVWLLLGGGSFALMLLPLVVRPKRISVAEVELENCNGCERCFVDCPYGAVVMQARTDGLPYEKEAVVDPDQCVGCGICVGACPTATPFRRQGAHVAGIELADFAISELRERTINAAEALSGENKVFVFGCDHGDELNSLKSDSVAVMSLPCIGFLPPSFIDFLISRNYADGVVLTGCRDGNCHHRFGIDWTEQRLTNQRDPGLRQRVSRERLSRLWYGAGHIKQLRKELTAFQEKLKILGPNRVKKNRVSDGDVDGEELRGDL